MGQLRYIRAKYIIALAFSILMLVAEPAAAATFGFDDRAALGRMGKGRAGSIGLVQTDTARGTGFLISECHVLTNRHVVFNKIESSNIKVLFFYGSGAGSKFKDYVKARPVLWGRKISNRSQAESDWAVLELEECIGKKQGFLTLKDLSIEKAVTMKNRINMAGQPADKKISRLWVDKRCSVYELENKNKRLWLHDCANYSGASGSPVFIELQGGRYGVVALNMGNRNGIIGQKKRFANEIAKNQSKLLRSYDQNFAGVAIPIKNFLADIYQIKQIRIDQTKARNYY